MAITGSGTQADPWVVHDWDEFLALSGKSKGSSYYAKFCDFNISNGEFVGDGSGTQQSPYICETYNEMMLVTGAQEIYNLLKISNPLQEGEYLYVYDGKYCKLVHTRSTIDLNESEYASGVSKVECFQNIDFNGWQILNLRLNIDGYFGVYFGATVKNLILLNVVSTVSSSSNPVFKAINGSSGSSAARIYNSIIQINITSSASITIIRTNYAVVFRRSSLKITARTEGNNAFHFGTSTEYVTTWSDCLIDLDLTLRRINDGSYGVKFVNCKLKGILRYYFSDTSAFNYFENSIIDLSITGAPTSITTTENCICTLVNSTKASSSAYFPKTGLIKVPESTLSDASAMRALGFPIVVPSGGD